MGMGLGGRRARAMVRGVGGREWEKVRIFGLCGRRFGRGLGLGLRILEDGGDLIGLRLRGSEGRASGVRRG